MRAEVEPGPLGGVGPPQLLELLGQVPVGDGGAGVEVLARIRLDEGDLSLVRAQHGIGAHEAAGAASLGEILQRHEPGARPVRAEHVGDHRQRRRDREQRRLGIGQGSTQPRELLALRGAKPCRVDPGDVARCLSGARRERGQHWCQRREGSDVEVAPGGSHRRLVEVRQQIGEGCGSGGEIVGDGPDLTGGESTCADDREVGRELPRGVTGEVV